ncbi:MAG: penicillin-binding protein [Acidobacteriia bacterium]|nr:penicillin-binding protein [Terriglobia bacterium]
MSGFRAPLRIAVFVLVCCLVAGNLSAVTTTKKKKKRAHASAQAVAVTQVSATRKVRHRKARYSPWTEPTYADSTSGDNVDGEDLAVRRAAVDALGPFNGAVVVADPNTGRVLTMVNQKLALSGGFQPCSTVKVSVALAALQEKLVERTTKVHLYGRTSIAMTDALAHSNNYYFANLGIKLGYERYSYYARLFGYGETAGLDITGEKPGYFPPAPPKNGGMGMLTSFGEEISQTPLELAALMSAVANGGTLYYLQYPHSQEEIDHFVPRIKRQLEIADLIPEIKPGMEGAVEFGTARRARQDDTIMGKTGTCSEGRTHLGWFGSFNEGGPGKLVVVVLLTGGKPSIGPMAAGVAGDVYRHLAQQNYFAANHQHSITPAALVSTQICCAR